ncbi:hypothetical protein GGI25_001075 [Coemansia spiralis]|uniref:Ornithine decarboxylase antizyme n=2 Tax=Coemansia TaxID=4863 RepID=A0A9W8GD96_9FUNG|nr:hypothetical protein BX070DRAFT_230636 [Coemansia spiralis]KAJ1995507.1 hypothetical protein EDC05_000745 [Coemansia umbellata]KAJ2625160.1 hypothetical protein GGI26_000963 [Coemansia sp. RSA 1358]KAJ2679886.1 hypothetical protein GGI25_001075 [Coemansia spiralis]
MKTCRIVIVCSRRLWRSASSRGQRHTRPSTTRRARKSGGMFDATPHALLNPLSKVFPRGVPSQGELKAHSDATVELMMGALVWHGFIVDTVLFVEALGVSRDCVCALVELAEELGCCSVVVALPKRADVVRAFLYSGFELVSPLLYQPNPAYILVGYDFM